MTASVPFAERRNIAMKEYADVFRKNVKYSVLPGGVHDYPDIRRYIYNALPEFFNPGSEDSDRF